MSEDLKNAFTTGLQTVKTDVSGLIAIALPVALSIAGLFLAIKLGMKFFRSVAK